VSGFLGAFTSANRSEFSASCDADVAFDAVRRVYFKPGWPRTAVAHEPAAALEIEV